MASSCPPPNVEIVSTYPARLNGDNNEIRLITILPERNDSNLVECNIDTLSLLHEKHDYKGFVKSYNSTVRARELLRQWYQSCSSSSDEQSVPKYPRTDFHRFSWGDFAALSYTWGDQTCMKNARINGQIVEITQNLEEVMKQLRENGQFGNSFKIWIDQLCINQSDDVERTAQVSKMREIYSRAWSVIAWLGCEKDDSAKAIAFMDKLADYSRQSTTELRDTLAIDPRFVEQGTWLGLKLLSDRPYWCRLWIVQELALGAADVVLVCGKDSIDWERFMAGREQFETLWQVKDRCIQIDRLALNPADKRSWAGANGLHHMSKELWKLSKIEKKGSEAASLRVLLEVANFSKCFDERDKVFGMLGVMDPKIALYLSPNYALKPVNVFTMTARAYIAEYHNLEILREGNPWGKASAPSWVPDWSWDGRLRDNSIPGPAFRADGINDPYIAYPSQEVLSCHAVLFDKIDGLGAQGSGMLNFLRETVIQPCSHESPYGNKNATSLALQDLLLADRSSSTRSERAVLRLPKSTGLAIDRFKQLGWKRLALDSGYYSRWSRWRNANEEFQLAGRRFDEYFAEAVPDNANGEDYEAAWGDWVRTSLGRRLAVSARGFMAWVPDNRNDSLDRQTKIGDVLAIIMGCSIPLVLRHCGGNYQVVGEAYIQGFMNGEITDAIRTSQFEIQVISLQ